MFAMAGSASAQISSRVDQFYLDPTVVNPAGIALQKSSSINLFYNKTFAGVGGAPENVIANLVMPLKNQRTGFGVMYLREKSGFQQLHNAYATYSYAFPLGDETKLSFGASLGVLSQSFDPSKAVYIQQNDPLIRTLAFSPSATRADFRASAMIQAGGFIGGFGMSRLAKPRFDYTYYNYKASYSLQSLSNLLLGYNIEISDDLAVKPMLLFNFYDFKYASFKGNVSAFYQDKFWVGVNTDASSQIGFNVGFKAGSAVTCGYSVNMLAGKLKGVLGPVHEFYTSIPFGGGSRKAVASADNATETKAEPEAEAEEEQAPATSARRKLDITFSSMTELQAAGLDLDTSGMHFNPVPKENKEPGIYLVVGMHSSEAKADNQIKELYIKGILTYKFYDPVNHNYYVWMKQFKSMAEASKFVQNTDNAHLPESWIRVVK